MTTLPEINTAVARRPLFADTEEFTPEGEATLLGRMRALGRDTNAGFLPTTHLEKNNAFELLDYAKDNEDDRLMPQRRLQEIFKHQVRRARREYGAETNGWLSEEDYTLAKTEGQRAVLSIGLAWGDFLKNAVESRNGLAAVAAKVKACPNPAAGLLEQIPSDHPGVAPLARYLDLRWLREHRFPFHWKFDPLHTIVDRIEPSDSPELRHKHLYDPYTNPVREEVVTKRITDIAEGLTIGGLRSVVTEAVSDQANRVDFWLAREREMYRYHLAGRPAATLALQEAGLSVR